MGLAFILVSKIRVVILCCVSPGDISCDIESGFGKSYDIEGTDDEVRGKALDSIGISCSDMHVIF
ncbi:hypothetical protein GCM10007199_42530 [Fictibacillus barbaricus]|nr:hypothetical protein GCM10007199_42530 [Fictibacillus barbaricus]